MALTNCPDCQKPISDQAQRCPTCGYPIRAKGQYLGVRALMAVAIVGIGGWLLLNGWVMPGGLAVIFGLFMVVFGVVVLISIFWKIASA